jgi:hypothetical protein
MSCLLKKSEAPHREAWKTKGRPCGGLGIRLVIRPPCQEASHHVIAMIEVFSMAHGLAPAAPGVNRKQHPQKATCAGF